MFGIFVKIGAVALGLMGILVGAAAGPTLQLVCGWPDWAGWLAAFAVILAFFCLAWRLWRGAESLAKGEDTKEKDHAREYCARTVSLSGNKEGPQVELWQMVKGREVRFGDVPPEIEMLLRRGVPSPWESDGKLITPNEDGLYLNVLAIWLEKPGGLEAFIDSLRKEGERP